MLRSGFILAVMSGAPPSTRPSSNARLTSGVCPTTHSPAGFDSLAGVTLTMISPSTVCRDSRTRRYPNLLLICATRILRNRVRPGFAGRRERPLRRRRQRVDPRQGHGRSRRPRRHRIRVGRPRTRVDLSPFPQARMYAAPSPCGPSHLRFLTCALRLRQTGRSTSFSRCT